MHQEQSAQFGISWQGLDVATDSKDPLPNPSGKPGLPHAEISHVADLMGTPLTCQFQSFQLDDL